MNKLSRTKRYQELRDRLDEETSMTQATPSRLSRAEESNLSHANQPLHPHQEESNFTNIDFQASPVMDELLGEVRQYNIDNGTRYENDTQINILRQLDSSNSQPLKNSHFVEMEENPELSGNTVKLPNPVQPEFEVPTFMEETKEEKIVLRSETMQLEPEPIQFEENVELEEEVVEKPRKTKKLKKAKKQREKVSQQDEYLDEMPSAKIRMATEDYQEEPKNKKTGRIINIVLFILILLLFATIGVALFMLKELGIL